ncbi:MAG: hypothetical protein M1833_001431 [Piccolia ochrophora]|nr:MAG: hypothetical protein M1833_001431 [Piccolia ochrophora]
MGIFSDRKGLRRRRGLRRAILERSGAKHTSQKNSLFFALPLEIRQTIYDILMVPGEIRLKAFKYSRRLEKYALYAPTRYYPPSWYRFPALALLRTCRQIHEEAMARYVAGNIFVIGSGTQSESMGFTELTGFKLDPIAHVKPKFEMIKAIHLRFAPEDVRSEFREYAANDRRAHGKFVAELRRIWVEKFEYVRRFELAYLRLEFSATKCPSRCCVPAVKFAKDLTPLAVPLPGVVEVTTQYLVDCRKIRDGMTLAHDRNLEASIRKGERQDKCVYQKAWERPGVPRNMFYMTLEGTSVQMLQTPSLTRRALLCVTGL